MGGGGLMGVDTLLAEFFGSSNRITLASFAERRGPWLTMLRSEGDRTGMSFLPRLSQDGRMTWYALGPAAMQPGEALELCRGFVGPSYAERIGPLHEPRPGEPHTQALLDFTQTCGGAVVEVDLGIITQDRREDSENTAAAFERLATLVERRPPWSGYAARSLAQVLADLDLALAERDLAGSEALLVEIERSHSISEVNLQFLRIRMLQAVGRSAEVLGNPQLGYLVNARRPRKVTRALLEAAHDVHLVDIPLDRDALRAAGQEVLAALGPVATELVEPGTLKEATALLAAGLAYGRGLTELEHVVAWLEQEPGRQGLRGSLFPEGQPEGPKAGKTRRGSRDDLTAAAELVMEGRPIEALALLRKQRPSVKAARVAFQIDVLLANLETADLLLAFGLEVMEQLDAVGDAKVIRRLDELTAVLPPVDMAAEGDTSIPVTVPTSWQDWLALLESGSALTALHGLAQLGASSWTADAASARSIAEAIAGPSSAQAGVVRSCAGIIVDAHADVADEPAVLALRAGLLELIALTGLPTTQELRSIVGWVDAIMSTAVDGATVERTLESLEVFTAGHPSPALVEALADLAAIVAHHSSGGGRGQQFVLRAVAAIRSAGAASDRAVRLTASRAASDVGTPVPAEDPFWNATPGGDDWTSLLDGLHIGIHTLMGSVASRARAEIEQHVGNGSVTTNEDHVATEHVKSLATGSDVVVLVTAAAKHSASQEIERLCPEAKLVRVASKGLSSLLRELEKHLRSRYGEVQQAA